MKRILAIDSGGIRGVLTLEILREIEAAVRQRHGVTLHEYFDLIAGTSTGAIIATCRSWGMTSMWHWSCGCGTTCGIAGMMDRLAMDTVRGAVAADVRSSKLFRANAELALVSATRSVYHSRRE